MGCDRRSDRDVPHTKQLSVSSNGSNGLRLPKIPFRRKCSLAFSILERIEWAATQPPLGRYAAPGAFQYPRTDRMGCDPALGRHPLRPSRTFSILERIEWAATPRTDGQSRQPTSLSVSSNGSNGLRLSLLLAVVLFILAFSILERIEWAATLERQDHRGILAPLSVSSNGSNGLRPAEQK